MANPYDIFAQENGIPPEAVPAWKKILGPTASGIVDRGQEVVSKYADPLARGARAVADALPQGQWSDPIGATMKAAGAIAPSIADAIRPPPKDVAQTPQFTRPDVPGTPYQAAPPNAAGAGLGGIATGAGGAVSTKESELTTTHKGRPVSDAVRDAADQAHVDARLANQLGLEAAQEQGLAQGMAAAIQANAQQAFQAHEAKQQTRNAELLRQQTDRLSQDLDAVRSGEIDPNRYVSNMSTGSKIFGLLGMALGGALAGKTGGPNPVASQLNQAIEQDIRAQEANLGNKRATVAGQENLINQLRAQYGDEAKARLAAHMMGIESVRTQLQAASANITNKAAQAHAAEVDAQLAQKQAEIQSQFEKQAADDVTIQTQDVYMTKQKGGGGAGAGGAGGIGGLGKQGDAQTKELSENLTKSGIPQANAQLAAIDRALAGVKGNDVPGVGGIHRVAQLLGGSAEKIDNLGYSLFGSEKGQEIRQAVQGLENGILKDQSGAAVSDQELMRFKHAMAGARDVASFRRGLEGYRARMRELEATVRSGFSPQINAVQEQRRQAYGGGGAPQEPTKVNPIR
jgi:hypothetical protein